MTKGRWTSHLPCLLDLSLALRGLVETLIRRVGVMPAGAPSFCSRRLLCSLLGRYDRYECSALTRQESDSAIGRGKEGMIFAHADIRAGMPFGAALTNNDVARHDRLVAELLDAEPLAFGVAAVAGRAACFFCVPWDCSGILLDLRSDGRLITQRRPGRTRRPARPSGSCAARPSRSCRRR
jgi:hypothetical protein